MEQSACWHHYGHCPRLLLSSVQFKMVSLCLEKPIIMHCTLSLRSFSSIMTVGRGAVLHQVEGFYEECANGLIRWWGLLNLLHSHGCGAWGRGGFFEAYTYGMIWWGGLLNLLLSHGCDAVCRGASGGGFLGGVHLWHDMVKWNFCSHMAVMRCVVVHQVEGF